ncbi:MAG: NERD domain-containing protein [Clostridium lundense]|nr:NERD domain-containing protein [Clostridium lundense]
MISSGKREEKIVKSELKKLSKTNFIVFNNKCLRDEVESHEINNLIFSNGIIFNSETKNHSGEININEKGEWSRQKPNGEMDYKDPKNQIKGHYNLLKDIFEDKYDIVNIVVNPNS